MVKNLPASVGDTGSILGFRKIQHAVKHLSPCATALSPCTPEPMLNKREAHALQIESSSRSPQLEKTSAAAETRTAIER